MVDISISSIPNQQQISSNSSQVGVAAPQTETQRAESSAKNVTVSDNSRQLEDNARDSESRRFEAIKQVAGSFRKGDNPFLSDLTFTIYNASNTEVGNYEIRFTDINLGTVEIKTEQQLFTESGVSSEIISGSV